MDQFDPVVAAYKHSSGHHHELVSSESCGCFYCLEVYSPLEILDWVDDGKTALCAKCGIDSVIGSSSGYPITKEFLKEMNNYWFQRTVEFPPNRK